MTSATREFFVILSGNVVVASCSTLELAAGKMNTMSHDDGHVTAIHFTGLTQEQQDIVANEALTRWRSKQMTGRKFAKALGFAHTFKSRQTINDEWEAQDLASWQSDDSFGQAPAPVEVANEYTAIKHGTAAADVSPLHDQLLDLRLSDFDRAFADSTSVDFMLDIIVRSANDMIASAAKIKARNTINDRLALLESARHALVTAHRVCYNLKEEA